MSLPQPKIRQVGNTELSWCKAVPGGTGITVLALLFSKTPNIPLLQNALHKLQTTHPILNSTLHFDPHSHTYSYVTLPAPYIQIHQFDPLSTSNILKPNPPNLHTVLEHELNKNSWLEPNAELFFASVYALESGAWVLTLRVHTSVCDRAAAVAMLRELLDLVQQGGELELGGEIGEPSLGIEGYIPNGQGNKPFWARGVDMLGYSLNSLRLANLRFQDTSSPRVSRVVRLELNADHTARLLSSCQEKGIKLSALLAAAGLIACHLVKGVPEGHWEKYSVVTLIDCRSLLDPVLCPQHMGFYHSAILNSHNIKGGENLWEVANRVHSSVSDAKDNKKHFTDMADLNYLMCKVIENPGLTPSGSLRTSLISVFEEPVVDNSKKLNESIGLEDYIGCASVHGVGPSLAIFETVRDGKLDCACVYPFPLYSKEQMQEFVDRMKTILMDGSAA